MNQLMQMAPDAVVIAFDRDFTQAEAQALYERWRETFPDIRLAVMPNVQIVVRDGLPIMFEFTGDISPTMVAEFQRWWEEVNRGPDGQ